MNMPPCVSQLFGGDIAERFGFIASFVMATDIIAAFITLPEWQITKVGAMWINFGAVC
jgi:hypothetical protein